VSFYIGGRPIEYVTSYSHLRHIINFHSDVFVCVIILYVVLLCKAFFMVYIIRLLVEILGFVVVISVGSCKIFCLVLSRLMVIVFIIFVLTIFRLLSCKLRHYL